MDQFKQIETFVSVAQRGSLSAAAKIEGVQPAVIGRRLDALEERLGVKLLVRTTRKLSLTFEGVAFLEDCQRILNDLANAQASVSLGGVKASGHIKMSAPAGFGRRHVAPLVAGFQADNPEVAITLDLSDRVVDLVNEGFDCVVRLGELADSSLASLKLGEQERVVVASPAYVARAGTPQRPDDLLQHECLALGPDGPQTRGWHFVIDGRHQWLRVHGKLRCNDGAVLHAWALEGRGIAWRSMWEVGADLRAQRLVRLLDPYAAPAIGIYALFPQRRHLALRVRLLMEYLKNRYAAASYWDVTSA
ncbi:MAG: LysR family transcriptional regulator [Rhodocyclaceae bacterium]|nr:LysR family transcriptional regulator [Rhodocyclaceae bacterium]